MPAVIEKTRHGARVGKVELIWAKNSKEFFFSNSVLIHDGSPTLVDPSANFSYFEQLAASKSIKQVVNTHYHVDHRSLNSLFRTHAKYLCHPLDEPLMNLENYLKFADPEKDSGYTQWLGKIFASLDLTNPVFLGILKDQDLLPLEDQAVEVVHLPGHTPGHFGLFFKDEDLLFTADVDLTPLGPWYANIPSDIDQFLASLKRLAEWECTYYVTSHGPRIYDRERFLVKLNRFTEAFSKRDEKILETLKEKPQNLDKLSTVGIIYRKGHLKKDPLKAAFERQMLEKHLWRLHQMAQVYQAEGLWHVR